MTPDTKSEPMDLDLSQFDGHTPGRWNWDCGVVPPDGPDRYADVYTDDETIIARFNNCIPEGEANARLIAAAPQLLAELKALRQSSAAQAQRDAVDAARYRWLTAEPGEGWTYYDYRGGDLPEDFRGRWVLLGPLTSDLSLNAAIDAAIATSVIPASSAQEGK